jgi:hypothetical protein
LIESVGNPGIAKVLRQALAMRLGRDEPSCAYGRKQKGRAVSGHALPMFFYQENSLMN